MSELIAALPMYDWPEVRDEVDAQWASLRDAFRPRGIDAPQSIVRRNAD
ncbi:phosphate ABC transporter substrate-binding protein, partial [Mesorhizobium sp. M8A.F.Ca.ET.059.01.1.1]